MKKYVTIKDIAKLAGVAPNTVSRALNNKPDVSKDTREKITKIAEELGYIKDFNASYLRKRVSKIIGVILADSANPFYSEVLKGIEAASKEFGYNIILVNSERNYYEEEKAIKVLMSRRIDGLVISPVQSNSEDIINLLKTHMPFVILARHFENMKLFEVRSNNIQAGYIATKHLISQGAKKILMINGYLHKSPSRLRMEGYKKALNESGIDLPDYYVTIGDIDLKNGYKATIESINKGIKFDGIFAYNDMLALGAMKALKEKGIKIPDEIRVIGCDDIRFSSLVDPALSTIRMKKYDMGYYAFELLIKILKKELTQAKDKIFDVELIVRKST